MYNIIFITKYYSFCGCHCRRTWSRSPARRRGACLLGRRRIWQPALLSREYCRQERAAGSFAVCLRHRAGAVRASIAGVGDGGRIRDCKYKAWKKVNSDVCLFISKPRESPAFMPCSSLSRHFCVVIPIASMSTD